MTRFLLLVLLVCFAAVPASAVDYTVDYDANGATSGAAPAQQLKAQGVDLNLNFNTGLLARVGFTFVGWDTAPDGSGTSFIEGELYTTDAAVLLYAEWAPLPTYAVSYDANGATSGAAPAPQSKIQGIPLTLDANSGLLALTGFTFAGWNTAPDGSGTAFAAGVSYSTDAPLTLYAAWTPLTYVVTYDANGATSGTVPANQTKTHGIDLMLTPDIGSLGKSGALFDGWNTAADGSGMPFAPGFPYILDADLVLYAIWTPVPGGGTPTFGFVGGSTVRQVVAGDRVSLPLRVSLGTELQVSVVITSPFPGLDAANGNWPTPAGSATSLEANGPMLLQRLTAGVTNQALVLTIPSGASGTMTIAFGPEVQGLIAADLTSSVVIRAATTTRLTGDASEFVAGQNQSAFSIQPGDTVTRNALNGTAVSGPQDLNLVAVNGTPPYTATMLAGAAEIRPWKPFAAAVDWDGDSQPDTGQWFTIVPRAAGTISVRITDRAGQSLDRSITVLAGASGTATVAVPASSAQESVYTLAGAAGFGGLDALLTRFQGGGTAALVRRGFVYGPKSKVWYELPTLPTEGRPMPWDGFYLADRTGNDLNLQVEALGVPPYIPLYPGWNVLALPPLRQNNGAVLPSITATDLELFDEFGNTIARSAFDDVIGKPQTWNGSTFVAMSSIAVGQGFFLKNNLSGDNPRMLYVIPGRQALNSGVRAKAGSHLRVHARSTVAATEITPATGTMGRPPAPPASSAAPAASATDGSCGIGGSMGFLILGSLALLVRRNRVTP